MAQVLTAIHFLYLLLLLHIQSFPLPLRSPPVSFACSISSMLTLSELSAPFKKPQHAV